MYEIRLEDGTNVYYQGDADYAAYDIECVTQKGDAGYLQFTIPSSNPMWKRLVTRQSVLEFVLDGESIGFFEVREISHDSKFAERVYAVGELAWLYDSIQPQREYRNVTPRSFVSSLLYYHNQQCPDHSFELGTVNVIDTNGQIYRFTNRETTLDDLRDKLVDRLGGQLRLRRVGLKRYIDYVTDETYGGTSSQRIYFGENLLDYSDTLSASGICSEVVPLGARLENSDDNSQIGNLEQRLDVKSVNDGDDCVSNASLVARFGHVRSVQTWDDVTLPENLLAKARKWLADTQFEQMHLTVKAIDLSLTSTQFDRLRMGDTVRVVAEPYGLDKDFPITKRTYHPDSPNSDVIELNDSVQLSYIETQAESNRQEAAARSELEYNQTQWLVNAIDNAMAMLKGSRGGYRRSTYNSQGCWQSDYYIDNEKISDVKNVMRVDRRGLSFTDAGYFGTFKTAKTGKYTRHEMDMATVESSGKTVAVRLTPYTTGLSYMYGIMYESTSTPGTAYDVALKSYVDGLFPSSKKTASFSDTVGIMSNITNDSVTLTPSTISYKYESGFLTQRTTQGGSSKTLTTKSYVDSAVKTVEGKVPTFSLSGTTLTIRA